MKTVVEEIVRDLAAAIFRGEYAPGDRLPAYRKLAESFGVTLPTAQRAVGRIHELGLIKVRHGSGATVLDPLTHASPAVLTYWVDALLVDPPRARAVVDDYLELRRDLAATLLGKLAAAGDFDAAAIAEAVDAFERGVSAGRDTAAHREADLAVVRAILAARPSIPLATIFNSFAELLRSVPELTDAMYSNPALNVAGYRGVLRMIDRGSDAATIREAVETTLLPIDRTTANNFERALEGRL